MPVHKDESGRRSVQAEVEVPGTPEEVWDAIATGPGVTSWFVPCQVDERVGGSVVSSFGPGMDSVAQITRWNPPHSFVAESNDMGPDAPTIATEWIVEAHEGGTCTVRVVHSWFADGDAWDNQFEGFTFGWPAFFRVLRLFLTHFRGERGVQVQLMGVAPLPKEAAWEAWTRPLGLFGATVGQRVGTPADAPRMAGTVEWAGQPAWPEDLLLRLDEPAPGIAHLVPHAMGGQVYLTMRLYLYGPDAPAAAAQAESDWQAWFGEHFALATA
ncbi:MAG TPA: SRPBCC domain-containing protein [Longimicrobium sp.]|nr:SRPBCC domain-containing protein [Longimicrobium sp.]